MSRSLFWVGSLFLVATSLLAADADSGLREPPQGFVALFNGKNLTGWKDADKLADHWKAEDGVLVNDGKGPDAFTAQSYQNFELWLDWKIPERGDSGVFLPGGQQVQIWAKKPGSGGFIFDHKYSVEPKVSADKPLNQWNTYFIRLVDGKVTVKLNDQLVMDQVEVEKGFVPAKRGAIQGPLGLQRSPHATTTWFRNIFIKDLDAK